MTVAARQQTVATFCRKCGRDEIERAAYREMKACDCGGLRVLCSRYEWALVDALRDELKWRRGRGELHDFSLVEQYPIEAERFDLKTREYRHFRWYFDAGLTIYLPRLALRCLVEVDGDQHYDRTIARDKGKEADAVEDGWARTGGLYVVRNHELRPRRVGFDYDWRAAYVVAGELAREMLGRQLDGGHVPEALVVGGRRKRKGLIPVWRDAVRDSDLDKTAKAVALTLSTWMNGRGVCYPGRSSLAVGSSVSVRGVDYALQRLEAAGWLAVGRTKGGRSRTNTYTALLPQTVQEVRRSEWETVQNGALNGATDDAKRCRHLHTKASESALKAAALPADRPLRGSAAPLEECPRCHQVKRLAGPDFIFCPDCLEQQAAEA